MYGEDRAIEGSEALLVFVQSSQQAVGAVLTDDLWSAAMAQAWRASCSTVNNSARKGGSLARGRVRLAIQGCRRAERVCMLFLLSDRDSYR